MAYQVGLNVSWSNERAFLIVIGVGKTSTAECVARSLRRPLFPVTCGDLGTAPETVANRLEEYFTLAQKWGCVLLLDEADVFLASRKPGDVKRNALVSGKSLPIMVIVLNTNIGYSLSPCARVLCRRPDSHHQPRCRVRRGFPIQDPC
jgi:hypothetical protein